MISTFEEAKSAVVVNDLAFYKDVLRACAHLKDAVNASEAWGEVLKNGITLDLEFYELLQKAYLAAGKVKEALQAFEDVSKQSLTPTKEMAQLFKDVTSDQIDEETRVAFDKIKELSSYSSPFVSNVTFKKKTGTGPFRPEQRDLRIFIFIVNLSTICKNVQQVNHI